MTAIVGNRIHIRLLDTYVHPHKYNIGTRKWVRTIVCSNIYYLSSLGSVVKFLQCWAKNQNTQRKSLYFVSR